MKLIQRDLYLNQLISRKENRLIKTITELRRSGKSYLLFKIFHNHLLECGVKEENIITLALDDDLNREYRNPDKLSEFLFSKITNKTETFYILLDEIQFAISDKELKGKQQLVQLEVDFICNKGSNHYYIQSAFSIPDETKMIQETSSLDKIDDSFKKIIVTQDLGKPWRNDKGYLIINILDFLLNPNSLDL